MSQIITNQFTEYQQSRQEYLTGSCLTSTQKENIQNQIAKVAALRLAIVPDPLNYVVFIQEEAHYKGQMAALQYLLDCSLEAEQELLELAQSLNQSQL